MIPRAVWRNPGLRHRMHDTGMKLRRSSHAGTTEQTDQWVYFFFFAVRGRKKLTDIQKQPLIFLNWNASSYARDIAKLFDISSQKIEQNIFKLKNLTSYDSLVHQLPASGRWWNER